MVKISKNYVPNSKEKYMCEKHKAFFKKKLIEWKTEIVRSNNEALYNSSLDDNSASADIVDQASSYTEKNVEMKAINRQIKLISEIDKALRRIREDTYGYCLDTAESTSSERSFVVFIGFLGSTFYFTQQYLRLQGSETDLVKLRRDSKIRKIQVEKY